MGLFTSKQEKLNRKLRRACSDGNTMIIQNYLAQGADINARDGEGNTPLFYAICTDRAEAVRLLIAKGADIHAASNDGTTPLMAACQRNSVNIAMLFIEQGCDVNAKGYRDNTPLHEAATRYGTAIEAVVQALLDKGADIHARNSSGETPLHRAAAYGRFNTIQILLARGADPSATDISGNRPQNHAKAEGLQGIADFLSEKTASASATIKVEGGWQLTAPDEIVFTAEKPAAGYCLTEIFNFNARIYTQIARNLKSGAESQAVRFFDEFPDKKILEQAHQQLLKLGGKAAAAIIYSAVLNKKSLKPE